MGTELSRPGAPGSKTQVQSHGYSPAELDADLAAAAMARDIVNRLGTPSIISKKFAVRYGLFKALDHEPAFWVEEPDKDHPGKMIRTVISPGNLTGLNCKIRLAAYETVAKNSVNIDGMYFEKAWSYLMKPKMIFQGGVMPGTTPFEEDKPSILGRIGGFVFGKKGGPKNGAA